MLVLSGCAGGAGQQATRQPTSLLFSVDQLSEVSRAQLLQSNVVTAAQTPQELHEAPAIVSVIDEEQIRRRGYRTVAEALRSLPGFDLLYDHARHNVGVRGVNEGMRASSRLLKLMIDSQPVAFRPSTENWLGEELIPITAVQRIEVIRGPASALYGADAFLGVVNVLTRDGAGFQGAQVSGGVGSYGSKAQGALEVAVGTSRAGLDLYAAAATARVDHGGLEVRDLPGLDHHTENTASDNAVARPATALVRLGYEHEQLGTMALDAHYQELDTGFDFADWALLTHRNRLALRNASVRAQYGRPLGDHFDLSLATALARSEPKGSERLAISQIGLADFVTREVGATSADVSASLRYSPFGLSSITAGADYTWNRHTVQRFLRHFEDGPPPMVMDHGTENLENLGAYLQLLAYPFEILRPAQERDLVLTFGLRYDRHNIYGPVLNHRLGINYRGLCACFLKLLWGTSFKAPSAEQLFTSPIAPGDVLGNEALAPERGQTAEAQVGVQLTDWGLATLVAFYGRVTDAIILVDDVRTSNDIASNVGEISTIGSELGLEVERAAVQGWFNLSWQHSREARRDPLKGRVELPVRLFPTVMAKAGLGRDLPWGDSSVHVEARWLSARPASAQNTKEVDPIQLRGYRLDSYLTVDAAVRTVLPTFAGRKASLQLRIGNLFAADYSYPGFGDYDIPGVPRTVLLTLLQEL